MVEVDPARLNAMSSPDLVQYAGQELQFYVDVYAKQPAMVLHLARNAVAPSALLG